MAGAMQVVDAWAGMVKAITNPSLGSNEESLKSSLKVISGSELSEHAVAWFLNFSNAAVSRDISPNFWRFLEAYSDVPEDDKSAWTKENISKALDLASSSLERQLEVAKLVAASLGSEYQVERRCKANFSAVLFANVPEHFYEILYSFFQSHFASFEVEEAECNYLLLEVAADERKNDRFHKLCRQLRQIGALSIVEETFTEMLYVEIKNKVLSMCEKKWESQVLEEVTIWAKQKVFPFLRHLLLDLNEEPWYDIEYPDDNLENAHINITHNANRYVVLQRRLELFLYETFSNLRISEMFDIIVEYPDSLAAIADLRYALGKTHQFSELVTSLKMVFEKRLLHAGANTSDIITQYISSMKALHDLDPSGTTLAVVSKPIQQYLRGRNDTVRCIVTGLTDDSTSELFQELRKGGSESKWRPKAADGDAGDEEDGNYDESGKEEVEIWKPEVVHFGAAQVSYGKGSLDIIGMLIDIYGSADLFLNEYCSLLSDKLLAMTSYQIDKELHNLELLKIRFGEGSLHNCEVMLKDLGDSKRLDAYVHNESKKGALDAEVASWLNGKILSASFWPSLNSENIKMHPMIDQQLQSYGRYYSLLKKPRALKWKPTLGVVKLNLSFEDGREVPFTVSPVLANLILHFQDKPSWKLAELAEVTELAVDAVRKRMVFWVGNGVCQEQPPPSGAGIGETVYTVVEKATGPVMQQTTDFAMEEDDAAAQANDAQDEVIRSYVFGMLTNFKMLPLERIHNMLKMFVSDPPYTKKIQELESLLNALIASEKLEFDGSNYSLKSS